MRVCIPVDEEGGEYVVAEHFGQAAKYVIADTDGVHAPEWFIPDVQMGRAKCRGTQILRKLEADAVACQRIGERSSALLAERGIGVVRTPSSRVDVTLALTGGGKLERHTGCVGHHGNAHQDELTQIGGHERRRRCRHRGQ